MQSSNYIKILQILSKKGSLRPVELAHALRISPQALHRLLKKLLEEKKIVKKGRAPTVYYGLAAERKKLDLSELNVDQASYIASYFSQLLPDGRLLSGMEAFSEWLTRTKQERAYQALAAKFIQTHKEIQANRLASGLFDLSAKVKDTLSDCAIDTILCSDFYSIPQFGRTHLGNLVMAAKSGQNRRALEEINKLVAGSIHQVVKDYDIKHITWAPHSIARKMLFLPVLKSLLKLNLSEIPTVKVYSGAIPVAQKSLSKLEDRIENARETIMLQSHQKLKGNVLIIDDALGSGATMNEISKKIKKQCNAPKIIGYAVVGSHKGFEVISVV